MSYRTQLTSNKPAEHLFRLKPLVACLRLLITGGLIAVPVAPAHAELPVPGVDVLSSPTGVAMPWVGAGSADQVIHGNTMQINQHSDKAILNWQSFNVGPANTVQFVQPAATSVALNRIYDNNPSNILGQITANGQVYLYNQNGFIFGNNSVVDTNTFMASTLNITDDVFLNSGVTQVFNSNGTAALAIEPMRPGAKMDPKTAQILIAAGAKIHTDQNGRIIIAAPVINNSGSLATGNNGQIILAASEDKVYLQPADPNSPFAGLLVEVDTGGQVTNAGDLLANQGNITMAGFAVNQDGRATATTSVNVNGSIRLLAEEQHGTLGGILVANKTTRSADNGDGLGVEAKVKFGSGSVTQVVAVDTGATAIDEQTQPKSYLEATGHTVEIQANADIALPGGNVNITATENPADTTQSTKGAGRIFVDNGATIDVSGYKGIEVPMSRNVADISVQSYELRNSPLQLNGPLKGQTVQVDLRQNTTIVDTSGAVARIQRGVYERLSAGGQINLTSSGDVIINNGANMNISGGSVNYQAGYINTTKLLTEYNRIVDISVADPNVYYSAIFGVVTENHQTWGVTTVWDLLDQFSAGQYQQAYTEGKPAGAVNIKSPLLDWNGNLVAGSTNGIFQRSISNAPSGGSFNVDLAAFQSVQNVIFETEKSPVQLAVSDKFPKNKTGGAADLVLDSSLLNKSGVQNVSVKTWGAATVAEGAAIAMSPGGSLSLEANTIDVNGQIQSAGGSINLTAATNTAFLLAGGVTLGKDAVLDVSGRWINDYQLGLSAAPTDQLRIDGGSVNISGQGDVSVAAGSVIKADGGAWMSAGKRLTNGKGGAIDLAAIGVDGAPSNLQLAGNLSALGLSQGGSLTLTSGKIDVIDAAKTINSINNLTGNEMAQLNTSLISNNVIDHNYTKEELINYLDTNQGNQKVQNVVNDIYKISDPNTLALAEVNGHFAIAPDTSFSKISLNANIGGITVKGGTALDLKTQNLQLQGNFLEKATGSSISDFSSVVVLPENLRKPLQLDLNGFSGVTLATGSSITVDKGSTVNLATAEGGIYADGAINAPAGNINLAINPGQNLEYDNTQSIWLGQNASLLALGSTRMNPVDALGRNTGNVLDGGNISIQAKRGYVVLEKGSQVDVSGTHAQVDILQPTKSGVGSNYVTSDIASNAGSISITAAEGAVLDGGLKGFAGGATAQAGTLALGLDRLLRSPMDLLTIPFPSGPLTINVAQADQSLLPAGMQFGDVLPDSMIGLMTVSADKVMAGGFSNVSLKTNVNPALTPPDTVTFLGDVALKTATRITIDTQAINWQGLNSSAAGNVSLDTAYLTIGSPIIQNAGAAVTGGGAITTNAQWTELIGGSQWNGFNSITLNSAHDLRAVGANDGTQRDFVGALVTAGTLNLHASQIYPSTLTNFTFNSSAQINVSGSNTDTSPLSAAGSLTLQAPVINQAGVLKAPMGTISLIAGSSLTLASGSVTSVSAAGQLIPFGVIQGGLDWLYPLVNPNNLVFDAPPVKQVILNAPSINMAKGSKIDIAGGGDLFGYEFLPVADGFPDYLQTASDQGGFAVLPALGSALAPYDPFQSGTSAYAAGSQVYLSGDSQLPAGNYTILPAHYALLPGAFLVTPQANSQDRAITTLSPDGLPIVPGYMTLAGTGARDARSSAFLIQSSAQVLDQHAQYDLYHATQFYTDKAAKNATVTPFLPVDSGQVSIIAQTQLTLEGNINVAAPGGRGARMDIAANNIDVVSALSTPAANTLQILSSDLNNLKVDSLLLGGSRKRNSDGSTDVSVSSNNVTFSSGAQLQTTDLVAVAAQKVEVQAGISLAATGSVNTGDSVFNISGDGAVLRLSGDNQVALNRTASPGTQGELVVASGATLAASKSMLLDSSQSTILEGDILMHGGSLNLSASAINMGEVSGLTGNALNLTNQQLMSLSVDELLLNSRGTIGFYGNVGQVDGSGNLAPVTFNNLVINAAGFSGFGGNGQAARLQANNLILANPNSQAAATGSGQGQLDITAANFTQSAGSFGVNGFNAVNLDVTNGFSADGKSVLTVAGDTNLTAGNLTAAGGSSFTLDASGHALQVNGNGSPVSTAATAFGGSMDFIANTLAFNANALLPSGKLSLHALTGAVAVGPASNIDLAGRAVSFADQVDYTPGGSFSAIADNGAVTLAAGSSLDLSTGGGTAAGGNLVLKAPTQTVALDGQIKASAGSATIDVSNAANFDSLMTSLKNAGISDSIYFRSRDTSIIDLAGTVINASNITLVADKGAVDIFGQLDADGSAQGGNINVYAGDKITLEGSGSLTATGVKGGKVLLSSVDSNNNGISGIELKGGSLIDVSGATAGNGGDVTLRALRVGNGINIQPIAGTVTGADKFYAEGVKKYSNTYTGTADAAHAALSNSGQINAGDITAIQTDTANYMAAADISSLGHGITLTPGVEIDYAGKLALNSKWDLAGWRYNGIPGHLTIRASGDLLMNQSLTDGFKNGSFILQPNPKIPVTVTVNVTDQLQSGESWSYSLAAGSDLASADTNQVSSSNNLVVGAGAKIRTGTGDMQISAGGNIDVSAGMIYNAGQQSSPDPYGTLTDTAVAFLFYSEYPVNGGDLALSAGGNIIGAVSGNTFNDWLLRLGGPWTGSKGQPTAWGLALGYMASPISRNNAAYSSTPFYQQNIGSFGGGNVSIKAGGDITNLEVVMPTTGKPVGVNTGANLTSYATNQVEVNGGGNMSIAAGGNVAGGSFFDAKGVGTISAGGAVIGGSQSANGPALYSGDTQFTVNAVNGVQLAGVFDPMILHKGDVNFFSYTDTSAVAVRSLAGDITLDAALPSSRYTPSPNQSNLSTVYPASLQASAFGGSVNLLFENATLFPSPTGQLNIFARQDIYSTGTGEAVHRLSMSDANRALLPTALFPLAQTGLGPAVNQLATLALPLYAHDIVPVHIADYQPARFVTTLGDIKNVGLFTPKKTVVKSGRDISNVTLAIQNINPGDVSIIDAGRDLVYPGERSPNTGGLIPSSAKIEVAGPGDVLVKSGRNVDLGASNGLSTVGNTYNPALGDKGANITVLAGLSGATPDYVKFLNSYQGQAVYADKLQPARDLIVQFMRQRTGNGAMSETSALLAFSALPSGDSLSIQSQLNSYLLPVMFNEVRLAGRAAAAATSDALKKVLYEPGTAAINTLFPGNNWQGDLNLFFSKLQTIQGGDINLVVPGGQINAGLAVAFTGAKDATQLGIVAQQTGDINAVLKGDFLVNKSRVFALDGGDIMIWSETGNIDAGKGAKSAISAPPPIVSLDKNGNLVITFPPVVSGSGIRTAASSTGVIPGNVDLFAPVGVVNAGEAGIGGTNVTISATSVLGANNIQVSGVSTGVPAASSGSVMAGLTGVSNLTANVSQVAQATAGLNDTGAAGNKNTALGLFSVEVLGFGD
ncbi:MAG: filamentous hemagglutinin family protein [Methylococcales bacterium]|nr:filamentous hemagglutinin family protein [Methylococcales bacterium]